MQRVLAESSQGSNMVMLNTEIVKNIKISVPPITIQKQILHIHKMWQREQQLTAALVKNREQMMQGIFNELLKETN
jgi:restriction endonuclease S subunit